MLTVYKPLLLGLATRPIGFGGRFGLCVSAMLNVALDPAGGPPLPMTDLSLWTLLPQEMPDGPLVDEGVAKLQPEFLVHGRAYAPREADGRRAGACAVRAQLGPVAKTLLVHGRRAWSAVDRSTPPEACDGVPIDWAHAFGGPGHADNPLGLGLGAGGDGIHWLPQVEHPGDRAVRGDRPIAPAGFGRLDPMWPARARWRGTYDAAWLQQHAPGFPPDIDWRHFNLAPQDQWLPAPLRGDEPYLLENLHPEHALLQGRLPGLRARCFARYRRPGTSGALKEVPLRLGTVWFLPHALRAVLIFHGLAEVDSDDAFEVDGLMGAIEQVDSPREDAHYAQAWDRRQDPRHGGLHALRERDLMPDGIAATDAELDRSRQSLAVEGLQAQAQRRRAQWLVEDARLEARAQGLDPDALGICMPPAEPVPAPHELPDYLIAQQEKSEQAVKEALERAASQVMAAEDEAAAQGLDLAAAAHRGPPRFSAVVALQEWLQAQPAGPATGQAAERQGLLFDKVEAAERQRYLETAHAQPPAGAMASEAAARLRQDIARALARGMPLAALDLTGADLRGMDLRGADFSQAWLERADLRGANASGANFSHAVLAHADLTGLVAVAARFTGANLGRAALTGAVLDRCDLRAAILAHTVLDRVQLRGALLAGARWEESRWLQVDAAEAQAEGQAFIGLDLRHTVLAGARLARAQFIGCRLAGTDLRGAQLASATFSGCEAAGLRLTGAHMAQAGVMADCDFSGAWLDGVQAPQANLAGVRLRGAHLAQAHLAGAHLRLADLREAALPGADLRGALLVRARLDRADLQRANLMKAVLHNAALRAADLRGANLHAADLSRVRLDGDTRFEGGLLTRARTWPRLGPQQQAAFAAAEDAA